MYRSTAPTLLISVSSSSCAAESTTGHFRVTFYLKSY